MTDTPSKIKGRDARRTPRRVYKRQIGLLCRGKYEVLSALQLSEGGLLFQKSAKVYKVGEGLVATLILPGGKSVVARGEVAYEHTQAGVLCYGVRFSPLALNLRRLIRNYVSAKTLEEAQQEADLPEDRAA